MSEMNKMNDSDLDQVSGGKKHYKNSDDFPGAMEMKENVTHYGSKKKKCPNCGSDELDKEYMAFDGGAVMHEGQVCRKCGEKWIYGSRL